MIYSDTEMAGRAGFAVQGKEIKTLYSFIFDNFDDWIQMEQEGMNSSVADRAAISKVIHVEWPGRYLIRASASLLSVYSILKEI